MSLETSAPSTPVAPLLPLVGAELSVPLVDGREVRAVNLDLAASAPALVAVADAVTELLPWYSSVHRGAGFASTACTELLAHSKATIGRFVGARTDDAVVLTRNTTDALNLLSAALPAGSTVLVLDIEHHANLLPWRRHHHTVELTVPTTRAALVEAVREALVHHDVDLVAVTGASNVTGELLPLDEIIAAAHEHGARVVLDAAQLAPHRRVDIAAIGADYVALSGHKLYAPFGAGALIGRSDWLARADPYLAGGGAASRVDHDGVAWVEGPGRHEGGTPNLVGTVALAVACATLAELEPGLVETHEHRLLDDLVNAVGAVPGVGVRRFFTDDPFTPDGQVGIVAFDVAGRDPGMVAAYLSAEHGVALRDGGFCAHLGTARAGSGGPGGLLRASLGVGSRGEDVDRLTAGLHQLVDTGPRWQYALDDGKLRPVDDRRRRPPLVQRLAAAGRGTDATAANPIVD